MDRLTKIDKYGHYYTNEKLNDRMQLDEPHPHAYDGKVIDKLAHYEDLAEKGLLVELDERSTKNTTQLFYIYDRNIWSIKFEDIGKVIKRRGITKFYTKFAEAEQALADMK